MKKDQKPKKLEWSRPKLYRLDVHQDMNSQSKQNKKIIKTALEYQKEWRKALFALKRLLPTDLLTRFICCSR